jgi:tetratricopeptide (TPR) repeat protein
MKRENDLASLRQKDARHSHKAKYILPPVKGWSIKPVNSFDFSATKDKLSFAVECVDASVTNYRSFAFVLAHLERQATSFSRFGVPVITVLDREFELHDFSYITAQGVLAVTLSNIEALDALSGLLSKTPVDLLPFQALFARRSFVLATAFSQNCKAAGDMEEAIAWGERAVASAPQALGAHSRLIDLLRGQGDIARARAVCREALQHHPNATRLFDIMKELAQESKDEEAMAYWSSYRNARLDKGSATEFLLSGKPLSVARAEGPGFRNKGRPKASPQGRTIFSSLFRKSEKE